MQPAASFKVERKTAGDFREVYTNFVEFTNVFTDFLLRFSVMRDAAPAHVVVTNFLNVAMSPQLAKSLHRALGANIAAYEKQHGPIPEETTPAGTSLQ